MFYTLCTTILHISVSSSRSYNRDLVKNQQTTDIYWFYSLLQLTSLTVHRYMLKTSCYMGMTNLRGIFETSSPVRCQKYVCFFLCAPSFNTRKHVVCGEHSVLLCHVRICYFSIIKKTTRKHVLTYKFFHDKKSTDQLGMKFHQSSAYKWPEHFCQLKSDSKGQLNFHIQFKQLIILRVINHIKRD